MGDVSRYDHLRASLYRSSKHMAIFGIWQFQARNYSFVSVPQTVWNGSVDKAAYSLRILNANIWVFFHQTRHPLVVNIIRPFGAVDASLRQ
jgi:hypothetical protein